MQIDLEMDKVLDSIKNINSELGLERCVDSMKEQLGKTIGNTIDKVATYSIKAMPIPDSCKDILYDVKESFKTKDFKQILKTVVNSSIREGLEILNLDSSSLKSLKKIADVAKKGGLAQGIKSGIAIVEKKYLNNNIVGDFVYDFFNKLKDSPLSKDFMKKMDKSINKITEAKDEFVKMCNQFKQAYNEFDLDKINQLAKDINEKLKLTKKDEECIRENKVIQNITTLINSKKEKLTDAQLQLCNVI